MILNNIISSLHKVGFSKPEEEMVTITDEPKFPGYLCYPNKNALEEFYCDDVVGQGFDTNIEKARVKAVGEFLERLCLLNPKENRFVIANYENNDSFVDPSLFYCYSEEQSDDKGKYLEELTKGAYRWLPSKDITSQEKHLIPAQLLFLSSHFDDELEIRRERISTGAALGLVDKSHDALKTGFLEVIERDACISSYLKKRNVKKIVDLPQELNNLVDYLERYQLEPNIFDVTTDLNIPSVLAVTLDRTGIGGAVNVGSNASFNYKDAIKGALLESIQCRRSARVLKRFSSPEKIPSKDEITTMDNRFHYWNSFERINCLDFWVNTEETISYQKLKNKETNFKEAVNTIKSRNYHIFVADLTIPQIKEQGFEVLKVVIPELHPLYLDERAKSLYSVHHGTIKEDKTLKPHPLT